MTYVDVRVRTYLVYHAPHHTGRVEIRTQDIGATIGTELFDDEGRRLVAYRPGTRYPDTAEEVATDHVRRAIDLAYMDCARGYSFDEAFPGRLRDVVADDHCGTWDPEGEDADLW